MNGKIEETSCYLQRQLSIFSTLIIYCFHYRSATEFIKFQEMKEELGHAQPATGQPVASSVTDFLCFK